MAGGSIKGITIEFRGDTTKLDKALRQVDKETRSIDKELKQVDRALKFNPKNVDLLRQKQELLTKKISETGERLQLLKDTQAKIDSGEIEMSADDYRKLQREIIETESKLKTFNGQLQKVDKTINGMDMQAVSDKFKSVGEGLTKAGDAMKPLSAAGAAAATAVGALAYKSGTAADDLNTLSKQTGISTQDLQKYAASADLVDVSVEAMAKANQKLKKNMLAVQNGSKGQTEAFEKIGVSVTDSNGNLRDSEEVFQDVITALGKMENETERDALAMKLMGNSASQLNPLIADQGETYKKVSDTLKKYNLDYIDQNTLDKANAFNDSLDTMKAIGTVAIQSIGSELAAYLAPALEKAVDLFGRFAEWIGNLNPKVLAVVGVIGGLVATIAPLLILLGKIAFAISSITGLMASAGISFAAIAGPIGIAIAAIAAIIAIGVLLYKNWDTIKAKALQFVKNIGIAWAKFKADTIAKFNAIKTAVVNAFTSLVNGVTTRVNNLKSRISSVFNSIKTAITHPIQTAVSLVRTAIDKIKNIINNAHLKLPHFKLPHFRINGGKLPWGIGGKGTPPSINVDWYAQGGIFDSPHLIGIGEAGAEAVVPLDKFWDKLDNLQGETNIVININGSNKDPREIAEEVKRALIRETNQRRLAWQ